MHPFSVTQFYPNYIHFFLMLIYHIMFWFNNGILELFSMPKQISAEIRLIRVSKDSSYKSLWTHPNKTAFVCDAHRLLANLCVSMAATKCEYQLGGLGPQVNKFEQVSSDDHQISVVGGTYTPTTGHHQMSVAGGWVGPPGHHQTSVTEGVGHHPRTPSNVSSRGCHTPRTLDLEYPPSSNWITEICDF